MKSTFIRNATDDNLVLQGLLQEPEKQSSEAVLFIHGIAGNFYADRFIDEMAAGFTQNNRAFLTANTRGHDLIASIPLNTSGKQNKRYGSVYEIFHESILDIKAWIDFLHSKDYTKITLIGHSLGASKVVYYLATTKDPRIEKIALISPTPLVITQKDPGYKETFSLAKSMAKNGDGGDIIPKKILGKLLMSADTFLHYHGNLDAQNIFNVYDPTQPSLLSDVTVPILAVWGTKDQYGTYFSVPDALNYIQKKALSSKNVKTKLIENAGHGYVGFEKELTTQLIDWIKK